MERKTSNENEIKDAETITKLAYDFLQKYGYKSKGKQTLKLISIRRSYHNRGTTFEKWIVVMSHGWNTITLKMSRVGKILWIS
jgi:hypothetical protein